MPTTAGELDSRVAGGKGQNAGGSKAKAEGLYLVAVDYPDRYDLQNRQWARYFWRTNKNNARNIQAVANVVTA